MKKRKLAAAAAAVLAGFSMCLATQAVASDHDVNVTDDGKGGCTIAGIPDIHAHGNATFVFHVKPDVYEFDPDKGIKFVNKPGHQKIPAGEFTKNAGGTNPTKWTVQDKNKTKGKFGYEVHVRRQDDKKACTPLDPTVFNDGTCTDCKKPESKK